MDTQANLRKVGLKATGPRMRILELFFNSDGGHLTAEDVFKRLLDEGEDIGLATVYRVLTQFEHAGLLVRHHFETGRAVFEFNQGDHHDHIVCFQCGRVEEFFDDVIEHRQKEIAEARGFVVRDHALYIYAECTRTDCPHRPGE
ncbi:MAG: ferric iron uptake transcriptional regulator [Magnetococcales bacterium]|nr:ferric iron uptake transcriptional regulator [Magnetococcales bacterium]MBF0157641.1 ferric iron uptake transcriptional regulator [Magnetococcales bacterium]